MTPWRAKQWEGCRSPKPQQADNTSSESPLTIVSKLYKFLYKGKVSFCSQACSVSSVVAMCWESPSVKWVPLSVNALVGMSRQVPMYACVWRAEVSRRCRSSGVTLLAVFWYGVSHWPEPFQGGWIASEPQRSAYFYFPDPGIISKPLHPSLFMRVLGGSHTLIL